MREEFHSGFSSDWRIQDQGSCSPEGKEFVGVCSVTLSYTSMVGTEDHLPWRAALVPGNGRYTRLGKQSSLVSFRELHRSLGSTTPPVLLLYESENSR